MLETKEDKQILAGCIVLILVLGVVSLISRPNLNVQNGNNVVSTEDIVNSQAYIEYLKTIEVDPKASQELFETLLTKEDVEKEVSQTLKADQAITPPAVEQQRIKTIAQNTSDSVNQYLTQTVSATYSFKGETGMLSQSLFSDASRVSELEVELNNLTNQLYNVPVPTEALPLHKNLLSAYLSYKELLNSAKNFDSADLAANEDVWPEVYKSYAVVNDATRVYTDELNRITNKYKISAITIRSNLAENDEAPAEGNLFVPAAHAIFGIADTTIVVGDIPAYIMDGVKEGLSSAFLKFLASMLDKLITKIEETYVISNFLYYSDALVNGQYANDYLNKYVNNSLDREIVKKFIPQFTCGKSPNLHGVFQAKANEHLGFNPNTLSINDPNYYQKMAKVGDFLASPSGWQVFYQDLATQAESAAQKAAERELTSPGLKTARDTIKSSIPKSINSLVSAQRAAFTSLLQFGATNAKSIISGVVGKLTETLVTKFVFQGVTANNGSLGVLKEQSTCVSAAVVNPVLALPESQYQAPPAAMTAQAAVADQCVPVTTIDGNCTSAMLGELRICSENPSNHTGQTSCSGLAESSYVDSLLGSCASGVPPYYCQDLYDDVYTILGTVRGPGDSSGSSGSGGTLGPTSYLSSSPVSDVTSIPIFSSPGSVSVASFTSAAQPGSGTACTARLTSDFSANTGDPLVPRTETVTYCGNCNSNQAVICDQLHYENCTIEFVRTADSNCP